ncbi:MAG: hypothetical protein ACFFD2_11860 [Promethearchaeota archaeon]
MNLKKKNASDNEVIDKIDEIRGQLSSLSAKYITSISEFPLIKIKGVTDINKIIDKNVDFEIETRKLQKKLNRYLKTVNKMLETGINAVVLHQHFLGCFNIAIQCNDFLCIKIFLSQAHSTFTEIKKYIKKYLTLSKDIERFEEEITSLLKFIHPSIEFSQHFLKLDDLILDDLEKIIIELQDKIKT